MSGSTGSKCKIRMLTHIAGGLLERNAQSVHNGGPAKPDSRENPFHEYLVNNESGEQCRCRIAPGGTLKPDRQKQKRRDHGVDAVVTEQGSEQAGDGEKDKVPFGAIFCCQNFQHTDCLQYNDL